jgi:hypothetical protein
MLLEDGCRRGGVRCLKGIETLFTNDVDLGRGMRDGSSDSTGDGMQHVLAEELERLLASASFLRSPVLCRLLSYLVEHRIKNDGPPPKAYAIATEALGRPVDFDPSVDSYPRVMVGRLRTLMEKHYSEVPWLHRLRIPQGSYEVVVQYRSAPPARIGGQAFDNGEGVDERARAAQQVAASSSAEAAKPVSAGPKSFVRAARPSSMAEPASWMNGSVYKLSSSDGDNAATSIGGPDRRLTGWKKWLVMGVAIFCAALIGGGAALLINHYGSQIKWMQVDRAEIVPRASVQVVVDDGRAGSQDRYLQQALEHKLRDALRRFEMLELAEVASGTGAPAKGPSVDYIIRGFVEAPRGGVSYVNIELSHPASSRTLWTRRLAIPAADDAHLEQIDPIIAQLAGDYGIIVRDQIRRAPNDYLAGAPCLAQYQRYRSTRHEGDVEALEACMKKTVKLEPQDSMALSAMSALRWLDAYKADAGAAREAMQAEATDLAARAYDAAPASPHGIFAQARAHFYNGDCQQMTATVRPAHPVNEYDADMMVQLGFYHVMCDENAVGEGYLRRALLLEARPPALATSVFAMLHAERGDDSAAMRLIDDAANVERNEAHYLAISAYVLAEAGEQDRSRKSWAKLIKLAGLSENARAEDVLRRFTISDLVVQRVVGDLRKAGVVPPRAASVR